MIAEEDKHVFSQLWTHWRSHCPISWNLPPKEQRIAHHKHPKIPDLDAVYTFDLKIATPTVLRRFCSTPCHQTHW